eukprot:COSAG05_NODE_155_length_15704_cov_84.777315_10_plen_187_part_00
MTRPSCCCCCCCCCFRYCPPCIAKDLQERAEKRAQDKERAAAFWQSKRAAAMEKSLDASSSNNPRGKKFSRSRRREHLTDTASLSSPEAFAQPGNEPQQQQQQQQQQQRDMVGLVGPDGTPGRSGFAEYARRRREALESAPSTASSLSQRPSQHQRVQQVGAISASLSRSALFQKLGERRQRLPMI